MRLSALMEEYAEFSIKEISAETVQTYLGDVRQLAIYLRDCDLSCVSPDDVVGYLTLLEKMKLKHNSVTTKSRSFRHFWKYLNRRGYKTFSFEAIPNMKLEPVIPRSITEEHYKTLVGFIERNGRYNEMRDAALVRLLWDTGARIGELCALDIDDLDLSAMKAKIKTEKAKGTKYRYPFREIFWTKETNDVLVRWLKKHEWVCDTRLTENPEAVFFASSKCHIGQRMTPNLAGNLLRIYCDRAKIPHYNPHSFRHHFGNSLAADNANNSIIMGLMGHASLSSSQIYTELNSKQREEAYNKFKRNAVQK